MKPHVLLVDDDINILHGLARALHKQPYQLITAKSADEAILILKSREVDAVVADQYMPGISGSDLLAWVAEYAPDTMRIMLTGNPTASTAIRAINDGKVHNFFTKPCDEVQLAVAINKAIEHRALLMDNRRLLASNRQQSDELQHLTQKLGLMARIVTKDLRTPLEQVAVSCHDLSNEYADFFEPKAKKLLDDALEAVGNINQIVDEILNCVRTNVASEYTAIPTLLPIADIPAAHN